AADARSIAFGLLSGGPLASRLDREGGMAEERAAQIAIRVLEALAEAHRLGVVHRDVNPTNIFLCDYAGQRDFVKVLDFGIAKRSVKDATQLTASDVVVG